MKQKPPQRKNKISTPDVALEKLPIFESRNFFLMSLLAVLLGLQVLIAVAWIGHFFPIDNKLAENYFGIAKTELLPEREMLFYRIFIFAAMAFQILGIQIFRREKDSSVLFAVLIRTAALETFWLALEFLALFKLAVFPSLNAARYGFYIVFVLSILAKIFWKSFNTTLERLNVWIDRYQGVRWHAWLIGVEVRLADLVAQPGFLAVPQPVVVGSLVPEFIRREAFQVLLQNLFSRLPSTRQRSGSCWHLLGTYLKYLDYFPISERAWCQGFISYE